MASANDGGGDGWVAEDPLDGEVVEGGSVGGGEVAEVADGLLVGEDLVGLEEAVGAGGAGVFGDAFEVFGGEHSLGEWGECDAADFFFEEVVEDSLGLGPAVEDGVGWLVNDAMGAHFFEDFDGFFEFFEGVFG